MKIKAVLFDLDGTLIDTLADLADAVNYALQKKNYPPRPLCNFNMYVGDGVYKMIERALPEGEHGMDELKELKSFFLEYYSVHLCDKTKNYPGMPELIKSLRFRGIKTAVVTNKVEESAKTMLSKLYGDVFDVIYGQRDGVSTKPDPTLAHIAMRDLGVIPEECVLMGDSGVDIQTAVNSGALPVGVKWGFRGEEELRANGAEYIISSPGELLDIINSKEGV